mgnify:FL=1
MGELAQMVRCTISSVSQSVSGMGLFNSNLLRSFAIGFALGAVVVVAVLGGGQYSAAGGMVPAAVAAPAQ